MKYLVTLRNRGKAPILGRAYRMGTEQEIVIGQESETELEYFHVLSLLSPEGEKVAFEIKNLSEDFRVEPFIATETKMVDKRAIDPGGSRRLSLNPNEKCYVALVSI
jgi:hypothetical protein